MSLALLRCVAAWCVTGWLCTADAPSGDMTVRQRENLVCSMPKGENRAPRDDDVV